MPQNLLMETPTPLENRLTMPPVPEESTVAPAALVAAVPVVAKAQKRHPLRRSFWRRGKRAFRYLWPLAALYAVALSVVAWIIRHGFIHIPVPENKVVWALIPWQAIVTFIGGALALYEYNRNFRLKNEQFAQDKAQAELRRTEAEKAHQQKEEQFREDQRQKQIQFEEKAQEDRFKDIQDHFASADTRTRANAALRLAETAQLPKPGASERVCAENYPFFLRAAAPLVIALHMEEDESVRAANKEALAIMVGFVKAKKVNDLLLRALIVKLYNANLTAKRAFIKSFAEYYSSEKTLGKRDFKLLTTFAPFTNDKYGAIAILKSLTETKDFQADCAMYAEVLFESSVTSVSLLIAVKQNATRLIDTRDSLAVALCALSDYTNPPKKEKGAEGADWQKYRTKFGCELRNTFLAGANLMWAKLVVSDLVGADLMGADLCYADLTGAVLVEAKLISADLVGANLTGAYLNQANLAGAWLSGANLSGAHLSGADLSGALLGDADISGAKLDRAKLIRTDLSGTTLQDSDGSNLADFADSNWRDAKFKRLQGKRVEEVDKRVWAWFIQHYGTNEEKTELAAEQATDTAAYPSTGTDTAPGDANTPAL